jgi:hypothetical protein
MIRGMTQFRKINMCRVEYPSGGPADADVIDPAFVTTNGGSCAISGYQMREEDDGTEVPTGRTVRIDTMTEISVSELGNGAFAVTGQSTLLADMGVPEDDRTVVVRVFPNKAAL